MLLTGLIKSNGNRRGPMATYANLVKMVRGWANREETVLPDDIIQSSLRYAADEAYRHLEIPPLESSQYYIVREGTPTTYCTKTSEGVYTAATSYSVNDATLDTNDTNPGITNATLAVPHDTVSFIVLRSMGSINRPEVGSSVGAVVITDDNQSNFAIIATTGVPSVSTHNTYRDTVYNETVDTKTFYDYNDNTHNSGYFTRKGSFILIAGELLNTGDTLELFYYRRLPALNARLLVPATVTLAEAQADPDVYDVKTQAEYDALTFLDQKTYQELSGSYVRYAAEVGNWLKDQNERVLLFGALHRCFDYLQEDQQSEKYKARFAEAILELNNEEKKRKLSAGQSHVSFNAGGLI